MTASSISLPSTSSCSPLASTSGPANPAMHDDSADRTPLSRSDFFSAIPRAVWDLRAAGRLTPRDVDVLGLLLDYKNRRSCLVEPRQETIAARLRCSVDTIQRSLKRLEQADLLTRIRRRDGQGRLGRCVYDLAPLLALMPRQAAALRSGEWGGVDGDKRGSARPKEAKYTGAESGKSEARTADNSQVRPEKHTGDQAENSAPSMPQPCGLQEADSNVVQADNTAGPLSHESSLCPVVDSLTSQGVARPLAARLVAQFGQARCREVLAAALKVRQVRTSRAAWLVSCLHGKWTLSTERTALPASHQPYRLPPRRAAAPSAPDVLLPDPLAVLTDEARTRLEKTARRLLQDEGSPLVMALLNKGRGQSFVRVKMAELARQALASEPSGHLCGGRALAHLA